MATVKKLDLSTNNGSPLAFLVSVKAKPGSANDMLGKHTPLAIRDQLSTIFKVLGGVGFDETIFAKVIFSDAGSFKRFYPPAVYKSKNEDSLIIRWGNQLLTVGFDDEGILQARDGKVNFSFTNAPVGAFEELCLRLSTKSEDSVITASFPVKLIDWKTKPATDELNASLEYGGKTFLDLIAPYDPDAAPSSNIQKPHDMKEGVAYEFIGFKPLVRKTDGTTTYILQSTNDVSYFVPSNISQYITSLIISPTSPLVITRTLTSKGGNSYDFQAEWEVTEGENDLSWLN